MDHHRSINPESRPVVDGRWNMLLVAALFSILLTGALNAFEGHSIWRIAGVLPMGMPFADLYPFPAAQAALLNGDYIYTSLEEDPWHRPYNYPVLWLTFMRFTPSAVPLLGCAMIAGWFLALWSVCERLTKRQGLLIGLLVCSPVVVLALERANTDVIVFCVLSLALVAFRRGIHSPAWAGLLLATTLKLFPVFGFGCFVRLGWRRAWPWIVAAAVAVLVTSLVQWNEIQGILRETPKGGALSYGSAVWVRVASRLQERANGNAEMLNPYILPSRLCAWTLVGLAFLAGWRNVGSRETIADNSAWLDPFRVGAALFLGTFLLGAHFVYRLIFLLFCAPWLTRSTDALEPRNVARARRIALMLLFVCLWSNPLVSFNLYYVREVAVWSLAFVSAWLLGRTLPADFALTRPSPNLAPSALAATPAGE